MMRQLGPHALDLPADVGGDGGGHFQFAHSGSASFVRLGLAGLGSFQRAHAGRQLHMQRSRLRDGLLDL
eukprot:8116121-Heterocapsa_arctica.AAC.1